MKFEKYKDGRGEWRWRLIADNNKDIIADSGEGYKDERDCDHGIDLVKTCATAAVVREPPALMRSAKPASQKPLPPPNDTVKLTRRLAATELRDQRALTGPFAGTGGV